MSDYYAVLEACMPPLGAYYLAATCATCKASSGAPCRKPDGALVTRGSGFHARRMDKGINRRMRDWVRGARLTEWEHGQRYDSLGDLWSPQTEGKESAK